MKVVVRRFSEYAVEATVLTDTGRHYTVQLVTGVPAFCSCRRPGCPHVDEVISYLSDLPPKEYPV